MSAADEVPLLLTSVAIGRRLGLSKGAVSNWLRRYPDAVPRADARTEWRGQEILLWRADRMDEWHRWMRQS